MQNQSENILSENENLRLDGAANYLGISKTTLWRLQQTEKDFPKVIRLTNRCCLFRKVDLDAYLAKKQNVA